MPYSLTQINEAVRSDPKAFAEECDAAYAKKVELKSHAKEYLLELKKAGTRIAAAASSAYELIAPCLERNGVLECFDAFVTTMEVPHGKDFPDVYLEAAKRAH